MSKYIFITLLTSLIFISCSAQKRLLKIDPERIILNITDSPTTKMAVTWRTEDPVEEPQVQIAKATDWIEFKDSTIDLHVNTSSFITDKKQEVFSHSLIYDSLLPDTKYIYRVGGDSVWSEWCQFKTAKSNNAQIEFIYFGDPQNDLKEHVSRNFREAYKTAPNADFWLFAGDIISEPKDEQISGFFYAGTPFFRSLPIVLTPGNHDRAYKMYNGNIEINERGKKVRLDDIDGYWNASFTLPANGLPGFKGTSYYFDYQGVRIVMINSNNKLDEQAVWLERILSENKNKWTVVSFHHPVYSAGRERDDDETRNAFVPVFDRYNVDLVLTGHDHAYARSYKLKQGVRVEDDKPGTVYVVSVSGPKMYSVNSNLNNIMAKTGGHKQLFQVVKIDQRKLSFKAYTITGQLFDSFELIK